VGVSEDVRDDDGWSAPDRINTLNQVMRQDVGGDSWASSYDLNGNMTVKTNGTDTWTYTWDDRYRLIRVQGPGSVDVNYTFGMAGSFDNVPGGMPYGFVGGAGCRKDPATGVVYMRARWYDSATQRFISRDPIGLSGGPNLYAYCDDSPVNAIDPMGLDGNGGQTGIAGGILGFGRSVLNSFNSPMVQQAGREAARQLPGPLLNAGRIVPGVGAAAGVGAAVYAGRNQSRPTDPQFPGDPPNGNWNNGGDDGTGDDDGGCPNKCKKEEQEDIGWCGSCSGGQLPVCLHNKNKSAED